MNFLKYLAIFVFLALPLTSKAYSGEFEQLVTWNQDPSFAMNMPSENFSETFLVKIKSFKGNAFRGEAKIITSNAIAEVKQENGKFFTSTAVSFKQSTSPDKVILNLEIQESLPEAAFKISKSFEISKLADEKNILIQIGEDLYRYDITIEPTAD